MDALFSKCTDQQRTYEYKAPIGLLRPKDLLDVHSLAVQATAQTVVSETVAVQAISEAAETQGGDGDSLKNWGGDDGGDGYALDDRDRSGFVQILG